MTRPIVRPTVTSPEMTESKAVFTNRLRKEGRWEEASLLKDNIVRELKGRKMRMADASEEAWRQVCHLYPPVAVPMAKVPVVKFGPVPAADSVPVVSPKEEARNQTMLEEIESDGALDLIRDGGWVYEHLADTGVRPNQAPSKGAWSLLEYARQYRKSFFEIFIPKLQAAQGREEADAEDQKREDKSIEEIQKVLAQFVEAKKG